MCKKFFIILCFSFITIQLIYSQDKLSHPVIKKLEKSVLNERLSTFEKYSTYEFRYKEKSKTKKINKSGKYWYLNYSFLTENNKTDKSFSRTEILQNYKEAAQKINAQVLYEISGKLTFVIKYDTGQEIWVFVAARSGTYELHIIETEAFIQQLTFDVNSIKDALITSGKIDIYGINFNTDSDKLLPGSEKILIEIVKLLQQETTLKIGINGHTDNIGENSYNQKLSEKRAVTVKNFLVLYNINPNRLETRGFGEEKPVATNETEQGRFKNRRVELTRLE